MKFTRNRDSQGRLLRLSGVGMFGVQSSGALSAPTNLATEPGQSGGNPAAFLTWDTAAFLTWKVEKSTNNGSSYSQIDTSATNSYTDTTFAANQVGASQIRYRVKATNSVLTSDPSNVAGAVLLTTPGSGTYSFPVGATTRGAVCVGSGANGTTSIGGGGGALSITALGNSEITYNTAIGVGGESVAVDDGVGFVCKADCGSDDGTAGLAANGVGDTKYSGGAGAALGDGGGAAGKTGNASGQTHGTGGTLSGDGGNGGVDDGRPGVNYGGGGGSGGTTQGAGAVGCIAITWRQAS